MTIRRKRKIAALLASLALTACGGSLPKASPEEPLPPTTDGTLAALDHAEAELRLALGEPAGGGIGAQQPPGGSAPPSQPEPYTTGAPVAPAASPPPPDVDRGSTSRIKADAPSGGSDSGSSTTNSPCTSACRALASMARATEHLCTLAGNSDARCESARTRVQSAGDRVRAHCPGCAAG